MPDITGQSIITIAGLQKLQQAMRTNTQIKLKTFKVSHREYQTLNPTQTTLANVFYSANINGYFPINANTIEFLCQVPAENMTNWARTFGLYTEDDTLFVIAKPPYPFPPGAKAIFKIQIAFQNINSLLNFEYIPFSETEQDLSLLHTTATLSHVLLELKEEVERMKYSLNPLKAELQEQISTLNNLIQTLSDKMQETEREQYLTLLDSIATLSHVLLELKEEVEKIKGV